MGTFRQSLGFLWTFSHYLLANSEPTVYCAHTGSSFSNGQQVFGWKLRQGPFTIGAKNFDSVYGGAMYSVFHGNGFATPGFFKDGYGVEKQHCPYNYQPHYDAEYGRSVGNIELCDEKDERVILRVNAVQQTDSSGIKHTLAGWLHLEVELTNKSDQIRMIYVQMYDEKYNAVGEFVMDPSEQCGASKDPEKYITPTPYQYLPCSAIGAREAKLFPSRVFVLTTNEIEKWKKKTGDGTLRENALVEKLGLHRMLRKRPLHSLRPIWFGAAYIKHPGRGPLECSNPVINDQLNSTTDRDADWILEKIQFLVTDEYTHFKNLYNVIGNVWGSRTCQLNPYPFVLGLNSSSAFGGRCKAYDTNDTSSEYVQACNKNTTSREFQGLNITFQTYGNYVMALQVSRSLYCDKPCRAPLDEADAINISLLPGETPKRVDQSDTGLSHNTRTQNTIFKFWRGRKFHGVLCILVSMFLMPVSLFSARYYKETFMKFQCKGGHLWYWTHLGTSLFSMAVLFASQTALLDSIGSWGRSQDTFGVVHDTLGWISHAVFIGLFILGGLRGMHVTVRKILMTAHSIVGFLHYVLNLCLICLSTIIPASPSLDECGEDGLPTGFSRISPIVAIVISWAVVDVIFHILLTVLMCRRDMKLQIRRGWYCPIIPILEPTSHKDMKGSPLRKMMFFIYVFLSGGFTLGAVLQLTLREQPEGCIFGETSCKAAIGCTAVGIALCKRLHYSVCK